MTDSRDEDTRSGHGAGSSRSGLFRGQRLCGVARTCTDDNCNTNNHPYTYDNGCANNHPCTYDNGCANNHPCTYDNGGTNNNGRTCVDGGASVYSKRQDRLLQSPGRRQ